METATPRALDFFASLHLTIFEQPANFKGLVECHCVKSIFGFRFLNRTKDTKDMDCHGEAPRNDVSARLHDESASKTPRTCQATREKSGTRDDVCRQPLPPVLWPSNATRPGVGLVFRPVGCLTEPGRLCRRLHRAPWIFSLPCISPFLNSLRIL